MPQKTLLEYTQDILSALDSDEVNSISDTVESLQVARILKRTYDSISSRADLAEHYTLFELNASGDADMPVMMTRPTDVDSILWIKYDKQTADDTNINMQEITFLPIDTFLNFTGNLDETQDYVDTMTITSGTDTLYFKYRNDRAPTYYTTYDDATIIFDSFDIEVDTTLQNTKTLCYGKKDQTWTNEDGFVPFMDPEFCNLLLNESLSTAFAELKQVPNEIAVKWANRAWTKLSKAKRGIDQNRHPIEDQVNYGRRR